MKNRLFLPWTLSLLLTVTSTRGQRSQPKHRDLERSAVALSSLAAGAVEPLMFWPKDLQHYDPVVVGTAFFVDRDGDFVTALHVLDPPEGAENSKMEGSLSMNLTQRNGSGGSAPFSKVDSDKEHDLALCKAPFRIVLANKDPAMAHSMPRESQRPFASLAISEDQTAVGRFVLVTGFPLGSLTPTVQPGMVAAMQVVYPMFSGLGLRDDLQISVTANHGNSGGPAIDLDTGRVVGVIAALVPAPLQIGGKQIMDLRGGTFNQSGIMLATKAKYILDLLSKNKIVSVETKPGEYVID